MATSQPPEQSLEEHSVAAPFLEECDTILVNSVMPREANAVLQAGSVRT
jgi:hypothetical protein